MEALEWKVRGVFLTNRWIHVKAKPFGSLVVPVAQVATDLSTKGDSDCGPVVGGRRRRAADGQQPVSVTTGEPARKPWRIMTADPAIDGP